MKQATLKAAGAVALGVAMAAAAAGTASAAGPVAPGGLGLPTGALTNPGALTGAVGHLPGAAPVTEAAGTLNPAVAGSLTPAQPEVAPAAPAPAEQAPGADAAAPAEQAPAGDAAMPAGHENGQPVRATRGLPLPVPGAEGLAKAPGVSTVTGALGGGLPGIG